MQDFELENNFKLPVVIIALVLGTSISILFWPGVYTWEVIQFEKLRQLPVGNDWKSPFVAGIFWLSESTFKTTGPVMLLQQLLFWAGLSLIAACSFSRICTQILFVFVVGILPPIWITEILLWKEAWTLSFLCFSIGTIFVYFTNGKILYCITSVLFAMALAATRQNAILLTIPSLIIASQALFPINKTNNIRHIFIKGISFISLLLITFLFVWFVNTRGKERCYIWHHALLWDLAGVSLAENRMLIPEVFRKEDNAGSLSVVNQYFTPYHSDPLFFSENSPLQLYGTPWTGCPSPPPLEQLVKTWVSAIKKFPWSYLSHRFNYNIRLLNIPNSSEDIFGKSYYRIDSEYVPERNQSRVFSEIYKSSFYKYLVQGTPSKGWIYLIVFLASGLGLNRKSSSLNFYLNLMWFAGIAYFLSYAFIGSGALLRYLSIYGMLGPVMIAGGILVRSRNH